MTISISACRGCTQSKNTDEAEMGPSGEPFEYSATVVRSIEEGARRDEFVTRIVCSGEMVREEWGQQGETRALIWRPDLGKSFLLSLDKRVYVESDLSPQGARRSRGPGDYKYPDEPQRLPRGTQETIRPEEIERAFDGAPSPTRVETRRLPDQMVGGYMCRVLERRTSFANGYAEVTRVFRAKALAGLDIRIETETVTAAGPLKVITERREIQTEVMADEFAIPSDFKRVAALPQK